MTSTVDPNHTDVQALTKDGVFNIDRLTHLVNNATKPIAHAAVSEAKTAANNDIAANIAQQTANQQAQSQIPDYIPPLYQSPSLAPLFQQMLQQIVTPPVPDNPSIPPTPLLSQQQQATNAQ